MWTEIVKFMNPDDEQHEPIVSLPGFEMQYKLRTKIMLLLWTLIFIGTFITIFLVVTK